MAVAACLYSNAVGLSLAQASLSSVQQGCLRHPDVGDCYRVWLKLGQTGDQNQNIVTIAWLHEQGLAGCWS